MNQVAAIAEAVGAVLRVPLAGDEPGAPTSGVLGSRFVH